MTSTGPVALRRPASTLSPAATRWVPRPREPALVRPSGTEALLRCLTDGSGLADTGVAPRVVAARAAMAPALTELITPRRERHGPRVLSDNGSSLRGSIRPRCACAPRAQGRSPPNLPATPDATYPRSSRSGAFRAN